MRRNDCDAAAQLRLGSGMQSRDIIRDRAHAMTTRENHEQRMARWKEKCSRAFGHCGGSPR